MDEKTRSAMARMYKAGVGPTEIGRELGLSKANVVVAVRRMGLPPQQPHRATRKRAWDYEDNKAIAADRKAACGNVEKASVREDALRRMSEIPQDVRDLTARLMGDPIPNDPRRSWQAR